MERNTIILNFFNSIINGIPYSYMYIPPTFTHFFKCHFYSFYFHFYICFNLFEQLYFLEQLNVLPEKLKTSFLELIHAIENISQVFLKNLSLVF